MFAKTYYRQKKDNANILFVKPSQKTSYKMLAFSTATQTLPAICGNNLALLQLKYGKR